MDTIFTARNAAQLSRQIDRFNTEHPEAEITVNFGRQPDGLWYAHGPYGRKPQNYLSFTDVVDYCEQEARAALDAAESETHL